VLQKAANGKDVLKITVKASGLRRGGRGEPATQSKIGALFRKKHRANRSNYGEPAKDAQAEEPRSG
jgi:hypothetical protein